MHELKIPKPKKIFAPIFSTVMSLRGTNTKGFVPFPLKKNDPDI
jgi:hypothetical protein